MSTNLLSSPGLVLRRVKHLEADARLTIFLRDAGKLIVSAKGAQRPKNKLKSLQEPFTEADFQVHLPPHSVYARLTGGKLLHSHQNIRKSYPAFQIASRCCETVEVLLPHSAASPDVYDILKQAFLVLDEGHDPAEVWVHFTARLLKALGHGDITPELAERSLEEREQVVDYHLEQILPHRLKTASLSSLSR